MDLRIDSTKGIQALLVSKPMLGLILEQYKIHWRIERCKRIFDLFGDDLEALLDDPYYWKGLSDQKFVA